MKTAKISLALAGIVAIGVLVFNSCKKDRIQADDYQNMDSFYNNNMEQEQEFVIDSTGGPCMVTCAKGTRICVTRGMFSFADSTDITYPFILKVVELYSIKDMLLWQMPSVSGGSILETSAEIRVRTFKNGNELILKPGKAYYMEMANMPVINSNMKVYFGSSSDWTLSTNAFSSVTPAANYYTLFVGKMGFVSAARLHNSSSSNTTISLTLFGTNTQNIQSYLSFSNFKGLARITNLTSGAVPVGEAVKLVAFGKKQTNEYVLHQQTFSIAPSQQVPLTMQVVTEAALVAALAAL